MKPLIRFRLRTLAIALTFGLVWFGFYVRSVERQREAVAVIRKAGGRVFYDFHSKNPGRAYNVLERQFGLDYFHSVRSVSFRRDSTKPLPIEVVCRQFPSIVAIGFYDDRIDDRALEQLSSLEKLEALTLDDATNVTDAGLRHICRLSNLRVLFIAGSQASDEVFDDIWKLPNLERLILKGNTLSDKALDDVPNGLALVDLSISDSEITDSAIDNLVRMKSLETLSLFNTAVTKDGLTSLKTQLPNCFVQVIP